MDNLKKAIEASECFGGALKDLVLHHRPGITVKGGAGFSARAIYDGKIIARSGSVRGAWCTVAQMIVDGKL